MTGFATTVYVDLSDASDDDIKDEYAARNLDGSPTGYESVMNEMLQAMLRHDDRLALKLLRDYLCDVYGRATL